MIPLKEYQYYYRFETSFSKKKHFHFSKHIEPLYLVINPKLFSKNNKNVTTRVGINDSDVKRVKDGTFESQELKESSPSSPPLTANLDVVVFRTKTYVWAEPFFLVHQNIGFAFTNTPSFFFLSKVHPLSPLLLVLAF